MNEDRAERRNLGLSLLRTMWRIREFELHARIGYDAKEIPGIAHLSLGQEAVPAGVCANLLPEDYVASTHRGHGHCLGKGAEPNAMMAELFAKTTGTCKGKGGSMHIADFSVGMLGANGVVGGGIGIAVGAAQGARMLGKSSISACFFGDGAINRGPFLEGLNWAAVFGVPVLFVCEDNAFSAFTRSDSTTAGAGASARAEAIGVHSEHVDGNDVFAIYDAARRLVEKIRRDSVPGFLHARTYRIDGHTIFDKAAYRSSDEVAEKKKHDPIERLRAQLEAWGVDVPTLEGIADDARREMEAAMDFARRSPDPVPADAFADVQLIGAPG